MIKRSHLSALEMKPIRSTCRTSKRRKTESIARVLQSLSDRLELIEVDYEVTSVDCIYVNVPFEDIDDTKPVLSFRVESIGEEVLELVYMDFRRYALDNYYIDAAIKSGVRTVYDLCEFIEEHGKEDSIQCEIRINRDLDDVAKTVRYISILMEQDTRVLCDRMRTALLNLESRRVRRSRKNEATDAVVSASVVHRSLVNLFSSKSVNSSWVRCATPKELKSTTWWNDFKAVINDISSMPGVTVEYRSENGAKTFAQFQKVVKSCANRYKYDDYELQLEQDYSNDRIFISGGLASKLSWDEIIISFK